jgi:CRP-like cAMP-binding protein
MGSRTMVHSTVAELTVDELRQLIREVVLQTFFEVLGDPDAGLELRDEFRKELERALAKAEADAETAPAADVAARMGLSW